MTTPRKQFTPLWHIIRDVPQTDQCVEWTHSLVNSGYGHVQFGGKVRLTHQVAFFLAHGYYPSGRDVCHSCDNRLCFNPRHLFDGSRSDNMQDCLSKGRHKSKCGDDAGRALLTSDQVLLIRSIYRPNTRGFGSKSLCKRFGVSFSAIEAVIRRRSWRHL